MNSLIQLINSNYRILFIAPPAWGKTYRLLNLKKTMKDHTFIFVSPLRALCDEFALKVQDDFSLVWIQKYKDWDNKIDKNVDWIITTVDLLNQRIIENLSSKKVLYIFDEFHLFYHWEVFREVMPKIYQTTVLSTKPILFLTATMTSENLKRWEDEMTLNSNGHLALNIGNQELLYRPAKYIYFPRVMRKELVNQLSREKIEDGNCILIFCKYRNEVDYWVSYFKEKGISVLGCKGGEASEFSKELSRSTPKVIVATTVLSHGVNLPQINKIYLLYKVSDIDFWIQMVGRGGRRGEKYTCYAMEKAVYWRKRDKILNTCRILLILIKESLFKAFSF